MTRGRENDILTNSEIQTHLIKVCLTNDEVAW